MLLQNQNIFLAQKLLNLEAWLLGSFPIEMYGTIVQKFIPFDSYFLFFPMNLKKILVHGLSVMFCMKYTQTLLAGLLEGFCKVNIGIVEFYEVVRNLLERFHDLLLIVVLCEVGILYLLVHNILLNNRSFYGVVQKLPEGLCNVASQCCSQALSTSHSAARGTQSLE